MLQIRIILLTKLSNQMLYQLIKFSFHLVSIGQSKRSHRHTYWWDSHVELNFKLFLKKLTEIFEIVSFHVRTVCLLSYLELYLYREKYIFNWRNLYCTICFLCRLIYQWLEMLRSGKVPIPRRFLTRIYMASRYWMVPLWLNTHAMISKY